MSTILLAEARFYPHLNDMLLAGARAAIEAAGHKHETLTVPGALELPGAIALAARSGRFCAFVALGVVIRGETYHFEAGVERKRARSDGPDAPGLCDRQRHSHGRERGAGDRARRIPIRWTRAALRPKPRSLCSSSGKNMPLKPPSLRRASDNRRSRAHRPNRKCPGRPGLAERRSPAGGRGRGWR